MAIEDPVRGPIRNPIEWGLDQLRHAEHAIEATGGALRGDGEAGAASAPVVRRIGIADLRDALVKGVDDFGACRTDVVFICLIYPLVGLVLMRLAAGYDFLPLVFRRNCQLTGLVSERHIVQRKRE